MNKYSITVDGGQSFIDHSIYSFFYTWIYGDNKGFYIVNTTSDTYHDLGEQYDLDDECEAKAFEEWEKDMVFINEMREQGFDYAFLSEDFYINGERLCFGIKDNEEGMKKLFEVANDVNDRKDLQNFEIMTF